MEDLNVKTDGNYRDENIQERMIYIDENLESRDLTNLKFLCVDYLSKGIIEKANRGLHIFSQLERTFQNKAETLGFVAECLFHLERYDLLMKAFNLTENNMRQHIARQPRISAFRLLVFSIAEDLTQSEFENAKFLIMDTIPHSVRNEINTFLQLCTTLEKQNRLSESNVSLLIEICKNINRCDLEERVSRYQDKLTATQRNPQPRLHVQDAYAPTHYNVVQQQYNPHSVAYDQQVRPRPPVVLKSQELPQNTNQAHTLDEKTYSNQVSEAGLVESQKMQNTIAHDNSIHAAAVVAGQISAAQKIDHSKSFKQQPVLQQQDEGASPTQQVNVISQPQQLRTDSLPAYKMDADPRGFCVIISNENFYKDPVDPNSKQMKERKGSDVDLQRLNDCFTNLRFVVRCYRDVAAERMVIIMDEYAKESHQNFDCFVCCILTHGSNNALYGSDGRTVTMEDLTYGFKSIRCKSLVGKPKLFFIQACMGREKQEGADIQQDSGSGQYQAAVIPHGSVPSEADFLLGYATVPGHVSYRSQTQGSWYITTLTKVLNRYAGTSDLLSMLVKVNEEVSKAVATVEYGMYKQVPAPLVTLRKRVIFHVSNQTANPPPRNA